MRAPRSDRIRFTGSEPHLLLRLAQEQPEPSLQDIERVLDVAVAVPRHGLDWRDLEFGNPESRSLGMSGPPLDGVDMTGVLQRFHGRLSKIIVHSGVRCLPNAHALLRRD